MLDAKAVGRAVRKEREDHHLSQEVLSGLAGIGRTHLSAIERGTRRPTLETFFCIAEAMGVAPSALMKRVETEMRQK